jgi:hypothetical protein
MMMRKSEEEGYQSEFTIIPEQFKESDGASFIDN